MAAVRRSGGGSDLPATQIAQAMAEVKQAQRTEVPVFNRFGLCSLPNLWIQAWIQEVGFGSIL
jgi:hypothetical protein